MKPKTLRSFLLRSPSSSVAMVIAVAGIHPLFADTASFTFTPAADTRIISDSWGVNTNYGSDAEMGIYNARDRSLLRFLMPVGATIQSANLSVTITGTYGGNPVPQSMDVYRLTGSWAENSVTWNTQPGFDGTVQASSTANPGIGGTLTWDVTSLANQWASGSVANNGLIIINNGNNNGLHFATREYSNASYQPALATTFTTPTSVPSGAYVWSGGSGSWGEGSTWLDGGSAVTWSNEKDTVFGHGSDTAGAVTISGTVTPRTLWFQATNSGSYAVSGGTIDFGGAMRIVDTAADASISSAITNGALFKQGSGKLSLTSSGMGGSSVNTFTGGTIISGGTLEIYGRSADNGGYTSIGTGPVTIHGGATLVSANDWATGNEWNGGNVGKITIHAGGTWTINAAGSTVRNGLALNGGSINGSGNNGDWGGMYLRNTSVTAAGNATSSISVDTALNAATPMTVETGSTLNFSGTIHNRIFSTGGITKAGGGSLTLSGANSYSGVTDVTGGTLVAAGNTALGAGGWSGSTMTWVRDGATLALQGGISMDEHMHVIGSGVGGLGAIRSISGNNSLTMTNGNSGSGPGLAIDGNTVIGVDSDNLTVSGFYHDSGSYGITKVGAGTLTLSSSSSYTGATTISAGKLVVNGNISTTTTTVANGGTLGGSGTVGSVIVQNGGTISPGNSPGILNVDGDYSQSGTLVIEVNGLTPGAQHDQLNVDRLSGEGSVTLGGSLSVLFGGGAYANGNLVFILLNDGSDAINGTFSGLAQNDVVTTFGGFDWRISYTADSIGNAFNGGNDIALIAVPEPRTALVAALGLAACLRRRRTPSLP